MATTKSKLEFKSLTTNEEATTEVGGFTVKVNKNTNGGVVQNISATASPKVTVGNPYVVNTINFNRFPGQSNLSVTLNGHVLTSENASDFIALQDFVMAEFDLIK